MTSRSDRPYGQFPRGDTPEPAPTPEPQRRLPLRERIARRLRAPLALVALLALSWYLVSAVQTGGLVALRAQEDQPTPEPTPLLSVAVYQHVAPSVVEVTARGATGEANTGAGVIVDEMADILTSLHIIEGATGITVRFSDGTISKVEIVARLPDRDIAVLRALGRGSSSFDDGNPDHCPSAITRSSSVIRSGSSARSDRCISG